ncbi:suppressor of fused domain protein [Streptomyces yangpuensis]|uniref:Suppressor of fused domain protein n=1 Tax=Streptomyces yangpuensis TaxID=1648182 RepID=A0ABY5PPE9_9ACTN|nr:suppressor of fused domain protein [Streptomyces yangpuensis]
MLDAPVQVDPPPPSPPCPHVRGPPGGRRPRGQDDPRPGSRPLRRPPGGHARVLWTLPVTSAEIEFRRSHGHEALERLFDEAGIVPTDPYRASVV